MSISLTYRVVQAMKLLNKEDAKDRVRGKLLHDKEEDIYYILGELNSYIREHKNGNNVYDEDIDEIKEIHSKMVSYYFELQKEVEASKERNKKTTDYICSLLKKGRDKYIHRHDKLKESLRKKDYKG